MVGMLWYSWKLFLVINLYMVKKIVNVEFVWKVYDFVFEIKLIFWIIDVIRLLWMIMSFLNWDEIDLRNWEIGWFRKLRDWRMNWRWVGNLGGELDFGCGWGLGGEENGRNSRSWKWMLLLLLLLVGLGEFKFLLVGLGEFELIRVRILVWMMWVAE